MDFFTHQENARNRSTLLVLLFFIAVVAIIAATYFSLCIVSPVANAIDFEVDSDASFSDQKSNQIGLDVWWWQPQLLLIASGFTIVIVGLGSLFKIAELRGGGHVVARSLGGTLITEDCPLDSQTKRLINIVEEMALASGIPVPPVFVLEQESSINAFAAGYQPSNAVIGVSRGAIETLSRDELQGVIAHEYSHILNGDMRINIRVMGLLHGILLIAIIGFYLIRIAAHTGSGNRGKNNPAIYLIFLGFAAVLIGSVGLFFARIIKAALSRQREFLADASAVQFTRNTAGIAGALKKIQSRRGGSRIKNPESEVASHLFFGNARHPSLIALFSTHPPLDERIRRIDPQILKEISEPGEVLEHGTVAEHDVALYASGISPFAARHAVSEPHDGSTAVNGSNLAASAEKKTDQDAAGRAGLAYSSSSTLAALDPLLLAAAHQGYGARLIAAALLFSSDSAVRETQSVSVKNYMGDAGLAETMKYYALTCGLNKIQRLQLLDLCHASLMSLSFSQVTTMKRLTESLVAADGQMGLFEFMVVRVISSRLMQHPDLAGKTDSDRHLSYRPYKADIAVIVSAIAHASGLPNEDCIHQFERAMRKYFPHGQICQLLARENIDLHLVGAAMDSIAKASSRTKQKLMDASVLCISSDQQSTSQEIELLRALGATLAIPCPPIPAFED